MYLIKLITLYPALFTFYSFARFCFGGYETTDIYFLIKCPSANRLNPLFRLKYSPWVPETYEWKYSANFNKVLIVNVDLHR